MVRWGLYGGEEIIGIDGFFPVLGYCFRLDRTIFRPFQGHKGGKMGYAG